MKVYSDLGDVEVADVILDLNIEEEVTAFIDIRCERHNIEWPDILQLVALELEGRRFVRLHQP